MKKISILLCGLGIACAMTGCGATVELTEEENELITEYAVSLLLKYDKNYNDRLVDLTLYEEEKDSEKEEEEMPEEPVADEEEQNEPASDDTEVIDVSEEMQASTIEEFYGIDGFTFQYTGYDLKKEYPEMTENETGAFFAMEATQGTQLLILKFQATNQSGVESELNMLNYGTKMRIAVNGETPASALSTMLLNDIQTYRGTIGAYESTELIAVIEVPEGTSVGNISMTLRSDSDNAVISLQ